MDRITLTQLKGACPEQRALFRRVFPKGAPVDEATALKAVAAGLDVYWLAARLLPAPARKAYDEAVLADEAL